MMRNNRLTAAMAAGKAAYREYVEREQDLLAIEDLRALGGDLYNGDEERDRGREDAD